MHSSREAVDMYCNLSVLEVTRSVTGVETQTVVIARHTWFTTHCFRDSEPRPRRPNRRDSTMVVVAISSVRSSAITMLWGRL